MYFNKMELFHHKHKCDKCGMEFKSKEELDEHMKMHMQQPEQGEQQPQQEAPASQPQQPAQENMPEKPQDNGNTESQEQPQNQNEQQ